MQAGGRGTAKPAIGIAFEGDLAQRVDAILALAMVNGFASKNEARNIAFSISRPSVKTAQLADIIAGFYTPRPAGGSSMIGMPATGLPSPDTPVLTAILSKKTDEGAAQYTSNIARSLDTADNAVLTRNQLLAQNDANAVIVVAGPATGLARLQALYGAPPQIATKAKLLVFAAGAFPTGAADPNIKADVASARQVFASWPTPIVMVGSEVGTALPYPGASIDTDFKYAPTHPVAEAYRSFKTMPYDAPASALAAVVYAVHPDDGYFALSAPGTISVLEDGRTQFTPGADGKHRYLVVDPAQKDRVLKLYTDMVSAQPPARGGGRGRGGAPPAAAAQQPPAQQQQQAPPAQRPQTPPAPQLPAVPQPAVPKPPVP